MMIKPIDVQKIRYEIGKIRIGEKKVSAGGKEYPSSRTTFRFTSADKGALEALRVQYGGEIRPWEKEFELDSPASQIHAMLAVEDSLTSYYEQWASDANSHRCDGEVCVHTDAKGVRSTVPCLCDPEDRKCKLTTRLSVILPYSKKMSRWTLVSRGFYFPGEAAEFLDQLRMFGATIAPITIRIEPREDKERGGATKNYVVPVLSVDDTPPDIVGLLAGPMLKALSSLRSAERQIAAMAGADVEALPPNVDRETGEIVEVKPALPAEPARTLSATEEAAMSEMRKRDWLKGVSAATFKAFKNRCAAKGLVWHEEMLEALGQNPDRSLSDLVDLVDNKPSPTKAEEIDDEPNPFVDQGTL